jgi:glutathione S-transferase
VCTFGAYATLDTLSFSYDGIVSGAPAKITYFPGRGRAEAIRMMHAAVGAPYVDNSVTGAQWPELKPNLPFGQLPAYQDDEGILMAQSRAIMNHIARKHGLYGSTAVESYMVDAVMECLADLNPAQLFFLSEEGRKAGITKFRDEIVPKHLKYLDAFVSKSPSTTFVVGDLSMADIAIVNLVEFLEDNNLASVGDYPRLKAVYDVSCAHEKLGAYLKSEGRFPKQDTYKL